jgi:hypothetical protein
MLQDVNPLAQLVHPCGHAVYVRTGWPLLQRSPRPFREQFRLSLLEAPGAFIPAASSASISSVFS